MLCLSLHGVPHAKKKTNKQIETKSKKQEEEESKQLWHEHEVRRKKALEALNKSEQIQKWRERKGRARALTEAEEQKKAGKSAEAAGKFNERQSRRHRERVEAMRRLSAAEQRRKDHTIRLSPPWMDLGQGFQAASLDVW